MTVKKYKKARVATMFVQPISVKSNTTTLASYDRYNIQHGQHGLLINKFYKLIYKVHEYTWYKLITQFNT